MDFIMLPIFCTDRPTWCAMRPETMLNSCGPYKPSISLSSEELHVEANSPHEQVNIAEPLACHVRRQSLTLHNGFHNAIPTRISQCIIIIHVTKYSLHCQNKPLLLLRTRPAPNGSQKLPDIYILSSID